MEGKVVIVTGARYGMTYLFTAPTDQTNLNIRHYCSSGIGFATAKILFQKGAKVYFACRNKEKTMPLIKRLEEDKEAGAGQIAFLQLDLDDPQGAKAAADKFMELEERLDILSKTYA